MCRRVLQTAHEAGVGDDVINYQDDDNQTALMFAIMYGHRSVVHALLNPRVRTHASAAASAPASKDSRPGPRVDLDVCRNGAQDALTVACLYSRFRLVSLLLEHGARVDMDAIVTSTLRNFQGEHDYRIADHPAHLAATQRAIDAGLHKVREWRDGVYAQLEEHMPSVLCAEVINFT